MGNVIRFDKDRTPEFNPTNNKAVRDRIKQLWDKGLTRFSYHARKRMYERSIDSTDIQHIIRYGKIVDHSKPGDYWRFKIEGKTTDDVLLSCVIEIEDKLIIVTVMD